MCELKDRADSGELGEVSDKIKALIPDHPACAAALLMAQKHLPASILYHSLRTYLYARAFYATIDPSSDEVSMVPWPQVEPHILFIACILHDLGTCTSHDSHRERFEVCGADAAADLLRTWAESEESIQTAWLAISLHSSPGIAERMSGAVRALRLAVRADFGSYPVPDLAVVDPELASKDGWDLVEKELPRLNIEKDLGDAVVRQGERLPEKAPQGSWPGDLLRARKEDPDWEGVNRAF